MKKPCLTLDLSALSPMFREKIARIVANAADEECRQISSDLASVGESPAKDEMAKWSNASKALYWSAVGQIT
jgi:hypothetical protein